MESCNQAVGKHLHCWLQSSDRRVKVEGHRSSWIPDLTSLSAGNSKDKAIAATAQSGTPHWQQGDWIPHGMDFAPMCKFSSPELAQQYSQPTSSSCVPLMHVPRELMASRPLEPPPAALQAQSGDTKSTDSFGSPRITEGSRSDGSNMLRGAGAGEASSLPTLPSPLPACCFV